LSFLRHVALTSMVRVALVPVGILASVVAARWLGPHDLGLLAAIGAIIGTAAQCGQLGFPTAVTRYAAAEPWRIGALMSNARWTGAVTGSVAALAVFGLRAGLPRAFGEVPLDLLMIAALALPFSFASSQFQSLLLGLRRIRLYNAMEAYNRIAYLAALIGILALAGMDLKWLLWTTTVLAALQFLVYHALLPAHPLVRRPDLGLLRAMAPLSGRAYLTTLLSFLVLRSDIVLINGMLGPAHTGVYSIAVQGADFLMLLPAIAGTMLFPRVAAGGSGGDPAFTALVCRHVAMVMTAACVVAAVAVPWAVPILFGADYSGAIAALWVLLPGVWAMSLQGVLSNDLAGRDYPLFLPFVWIVVLAVNVGLNVAWLPRLGIVAAAASSTLAYGLAFILMTVYWRRRFPEVRWTRLLLVDGADLRSLAWRARESMATTETRQEQPRP
jgi:O-antigen/teichoic acid export membrane protein